MLGLDRFARIMIAGILGVLKAVVLLVACLVVGVVFMRAGLQWYASGTFMLLPSMAPASSGTAEVAIIGATPRQAAEIRSAVASLRYRLPARAVTFSVTDKPRCVECGGDYIPAADLIQINRTGLDQGGFVLRQAVAHEIGHYVDQHYLTETQRRRFMQLRHIPPDMRWLSPTWPWEDRPAEDFAEVFAVLSVTTVARPPQTSYGPVRNPVALERFLTSAGVRFGRPSAQPDLRSVASEELALFGSVTQNPRTRVVWWALIAVYVAYSAYVAMSRAWQGGSSTLAPPAPTP